MLVNAPATFQKFREVVLNRLVRDGCMPGVSWCISSQQNFWGALAKVFQQPRSAGLTLKLKKCKFVQLEVCYLGHAVSVEGVQTDPAKL